MYWKKNEKDEVESRKKAEREAIEQAKAVEAAREKRRAERKLNFLLSSGELYSHFMQKKIKSECGRKCPKFEVGDGRLTRSLPQPTKQPMHLKPPFPHFPVPWQMAPTSITRTWEISTLMTVSENYATSAGHRQDPDSHLHLR